MADTQQREVKKLPTLRGKTVVNLFFEDSTRTRISFEAAAKRLSADVINFSREGLERLEGREPAGHRADPRRRWARMPSSSATAPPARRARSPTSGWIDAGRRQRRRRHARAPDAGAARRVHDPQAPARRRQPRPRPRRRRASTIVGDILHSRVARSNVWLLDTLGADVTLVAPPTLRPARRRRHGRSRVVLRPRRGDRRRARTSLMMLRIQLERMNAAYFPTEREYSRQLGPRRRAARRARSR